MPTSTAHFSAGRSDGRLFSVDWSRLAAGFPVWSRRAICVLHRHGACRANPIRIVYSAIKEIPFYIGRGNFRPLGRMLDYAEHSFSFEFASITGAPLPVIHGLFRVGIIVVAGLAGLVSLYLLSRSAEAGGRETIHSVLLAAVWVYPILFAASVVAAGAGSPFTLFPFLYVGSSALAMWAAIVVARDGT